MRYIRFLIFISLLYFIIGSFNVFYSALGFIYPFNSSEFHRYTRIFTLFTVLFLLLDKEERKQ